MCTRKLNYLTLLHEYNKFQIICNQIDYEKQYYKF